MKKLLLALCGVLIATAAQAQYINTAIRCNAAAIYDTSVLGSLEVVNNPQIGGIYVCGYTFGSVTTATTSVKLTYSTPGVVNTSGIGAQAVVTGALQVPITPGWTFVSATNPSFLADTSSAYRGLFVPNGNQLNVTTSGSTSPIQGTIYYWTQNP